MTTIEDPATMCPIQARALFRGGTVETTAGWAAGHTQANLIAVPADWAYDVLLFAHRNPQPCPVLDVTDRGLATTVLAPTADLRTDLPRYRVWEHGQLVGEPTDVADRWRDDMVAFLIGCSFTFETALVDAGVPLRHVEQGRNVAMYVTNWECRPAGRLHGRLVVSMRPIPAGQVDTVIEVSARMPAAHGAPVHTGDPATLGIAHLDHPDFGDPVDSGPRRRAGVLGLRGHHPDRADGVASTLRDHPRPRALFITDVTDTNYRIAT
jgi:uncharacterized protein YcsI (UPF0317 family)